LYGTDIINNYFIILCLYFNTSDIF
jgi:hypothetical protein